MIILTLQHIAKSFGTDMILKGIDLSLGHQDRLGLVGANGSGKTTLLRIIQGELHHDEGEIILSRGIRSGYLQQSYAVEEGKTVLQEAESVFSHLVKIEVKLRWLEKEMSLASEDGKLQKLYTEYSKLNEQFESNDGYSYHSQTLGVLLGLGLDKSRHQQMASSLSGGELTRLGLAKLLLKKPELLLLDEPTNHLDMEAMEWLEEYLKSYPSALIVISHDRYFLDKVCTDMAELLFGVVETYHGNYSQFLSQRALRFASRLKEYNQQQKEIQRQKTIIARFRSFNREKSIKAAESREKMLDRIEIVDKPKEERQIVFRFKARRRMGENALTAWGLTKSFADRILFEEVSIELKAKDRVALIGPNGVGKTTLLECLMGIQPLDSGRVIFGANADIGYYDQRQTSLNADNDVLSELWNDFPHLTQTEIRGALGLFQFNGDDVFTPIGLLSGGERGRVALAKLMLRGDNLLIMDEPTNHLDADSREVLECALDGYDGTLLVVSHDRYFINRFATKIIIMENQGIQLFEGNYQDYLNKMENQGEEEKKFVQCKTKTEIARERRFEKARQEDIQALMKAVENAEDLIRQKEKELLLATEKYADPDVYSNPEKSAEQARICRSLKIEVEEAYRLWQTAETELETCSR